jgi:homogentisate 1,2-dioxygenase
LQTFERATSADLSKPDYIKDTMAFMFETRCIIRPSRQALESSQLQAQYFQCWQGLKKRFDPQKR